MNLHMRWVGIACISTCQVTVDFSVENLYLEKAHLQTYSYYFFGGFVFLSRMLILSCEYARTDTNQDGKACLRISKEVGVLTRVIVVKDNF